MVSIVTILYYTGLENLFSEYPNETLDFACHLCRSNVSLKMKTTLTLGVFLRYIKSQVFHTLLQCYLHSGQEICHFVRYSFG